MLLLYAGEPLRRIPRRIVYALLGAALAAGAPAGLLLVRFASGGGDSFSWMGREIASEPLTYVYVAVSTVTVFALFGWLLGQQADRLIELSTTDALTRLLNARGFYQRLHQELARARRSRQPLSLVIIDLDGLKSICDPGPVTLVTLPRWQSLSENNKIQRGSVTRWAITRFAP
jgi:hypothetical protein